MDDRSSSVAAHSNGHTEVDVTLSLAQELARCPVTAAAQRRIESAHHRSLRMVRCEHRDGVLVLTGQVPSYHHKQIAQECVRAVPGVNLIKNMLQVVPQPPR